MSNAKIKENEQAISTGKHARASVNKTIRTNKRQNVNEYSTASAQILLYRNMNTHSLLSSNHVKIKQSKRTPVTANMVPSRFTVA